MSRDSISLKQEKAKLVRCVAIVVQRALTLFLFVFVCFPMLWHVLEMLQRLQLFAWGVVLLDVVMRFNVSLLLYVRLRCVWLFSYS